MIRTHGLNHISLSVADLDASVAFYSTLFGVREYYRDENSVQVLGPGESDVLVFECRPSHGARGGIDHFGFRLVSPDDMADARAAVDAIGAKVLRQGEHGPGLPYLYIEDPDGYEIEIWYEPPADASA